MRYIAIILFLGVCVFLPATIDAEVTGEVVYRHPDNLNELWITDVTDVSNARLLFRHEYNIRGFSVQKNGPYIATLTEYDQQDLTFDIYLIDTDNIHQEGQLLTHQRFNEILDVDISQHGDVIFTNYLLARDLDGKLRTNPPPMSGIYLFQKYEIDNPTTSIFTEIQQLITQLPQIDVPPIRETLIKEVEAHRVVLSSDKAYIAYDTAEGIFLLKTKTGEVIRVSKDGSMPAFSPDGKKLAFAYRFFGPAHEISIFSVSNIRPLRVIRNLSPHFDFLDLKWSPDGEHIIYTAYGGAFFRPNFSYHTYAIPFDGGPEVKILDMQGKGVSLFDWTTSEVPFDVEHKNRVTTLWGKLKQ